jgi:aspartate aminotransferase-like enzyme
LTAVKCPEGLDCKKLVSCMKEKGMTIAGGQDHLKGKIFRISHMGYVDVFDLVEVFSALEICLYQLGYRKFTLGTSLRAILETYYSLAL